MSRLGALKDVGIYGGLVDIAKREGVKGLYRGLTPSLMALLPNWAVYFTVYDSLKEVSVAAWFGIDALGLHNACIAILLYCIAILLY